MKLDFSADRLISMGIILLKAIIILVAGHYITLFLIKLMKRSLNRINIDISLEKFFEKALYITLHIIIILSALSTLGISTSGLLAALSAAAVAVALALKDSLSSIAVSYTHLKRATFLKPLLWRSTETDGRLQN